MQSPELPAILTSTPPRASCTHHPVRAAVACHPCQDAAARKDAWIDECARAVIKLRDDVVTAQSILDSPGARAAAYRLPADRSPDQVAADQAAMRASRPARAAAQTAAVRATVGLRPLDVAGDELRRAGAHRGYLAASAALAASIADHPANGDRHDLAPGGTCASCGATSHDAAVLTSNCGEVRCARCWPLDTVLERARAVARADKQNRRRRAADQADRESAHLARLAAARSTTP